MSTLYRTSIVAALILSTALAGCGGGGGGGGSPSVADSQPTAVVRLADSTAPAAFDFSVYESYVGLSSSVLLSRVPSFTVQNADETYVTIWFVNEGGEREQVFFGTVQALRAQDSAGGLTVRVPGNVPVLHYQVYDADQTSPEVLV